MSAANKQSESKEVQKTRIKSGAIYLAVSALVLFFLWFCPNALGIDFAALLRGGEAVAVLRIALGIFFLFILAASIRYVISSFTLEGETWREGLANALRSHVFGRDSVAIVLLAFGGIALIVWGCIELTS